MGRRSRRRGRRRPAAALRGLAALAVLALLAGSAGACTDDEDARPGPTTAPRVTTSVVDRSGVLLAGVPGQTTSTIAQAGHATIAGSVRGPGGLVPGATVRLERLVGGTEVRTDVATGADGRFSVSGLPGGRYRVRAFLPPSLVQLKPEVRFLADGANHDFDLVVEEEGGLVVRADAAPDPPVRGQAVNLVALVLTRTVSPDGLVRSTPVVGSRVELAGLGRWVLRSDRSPSPGGDDLDGSGDAVGGGAGRASAVTDGQGAVRFELRCASAGDPGLALRVPVRSAAPPPDPAAPPTTAAPTVAAVALQLPACVEPAPASPTTSTSAPRADGSTTVTTTSVPSTQP